MDTARYVVAVLMLVGVAFAIPYWYIIHPLASFWRRLGPLLTYLIVVTISALIGVGVYLVRDRILSIDLGTNYALVPPAVISYGIAVAIELRSRRHLKFRIRVGLPELTPDRGASTLLQHGIYARIRHPRYVSFMFGVLAVAFFTNYLAMYVLVPAAALLLYLVAVLEERELIDRLGEAYVNYSQEVPRFIPRLGN
jgi:protein-S-isoprenylcysteine O-methyltransferase Ste14